MEHATKERHRRAGGGRKKAGGEGNPWVYASKQTPHLPCRPTHAAPPAVPNSVARHGHWTPSPHLAFPWGRAPPPAPGLINKQLNNCRIAMLSHVKQLSMQYTPTHYSTAPRPVPIRTCIRPFSMRTIQAASGRNLLPCIQSSRRTTLHLQILQSMHLSESFSESSGELGEWRSYPISLKCIRFVETVSERCCSCSLFRAGGRWVRVSGFGLPAAHGRFEFEGGHKQASKDHGLSAMLVETVSER